MQLQLWLFKFHFYDFSCVCRFGIDKYTYCRSWVWHTQIIIYLQMPWRYLPHELCCNDRSVCRFGKCLCSFSIDFPFGTNQPSFDGLATETHDKFTSWMCSIIIECVWSNQNDKIWLTIPFSYARCPIFSFVPLEIAFYSLFSPLAIFLVCFTLSYTFVDVNISFSHWFIFSCALFSAVVAAASELQFAIIHQSWIGRVRNAVVMCSPGRGILSHAWMCDHCAFCVCIT